MSVYPLHHHVWANETDAIGAALDDGADIDLVDLRGRTPLMLAVCLGRLESARLLIGRGADVHVHSPDGWSLADEATATGDPELLRSVLEQIASDSIPSQSQTATSRRLEDVDDFYVELHWQLQTKVPLPNPVVPSDTYRIYKKGHRLRIDTQLSSDRWQSIQSMWKQSLKTYIYIDSTSDGDPAKLVEIDHDQETVKQTNLARSATESVIISDADLQRRLTSPLIRTAVDMDHIVFEAAKKEGMLAYITGNTGLYVVDTLSGWQAKQFVSNNVMVTSHIRMEHLTSETKSTWTHFLDGFKNFVNPSGATDEERPPLATEDAYFDANTTDVTIGRPQVVQTTEYAMNASVWMAQQYPLSLQAQILPAIDLIVDSISQSAETEQMKKLHDVMHCALPSGFPVKIELPMLRMVTANVRFENPNATYRPVWGTTGTFEDGSFAIQDEVFAVPPKYGIVHGDRIWRPVVTSNENAEAVLLNYAIQQSLNESRSTVGREESQAANEAGAHSLDADLERALDASRAEFAAAEQTRQQEEADLLERTIQLSLAEQ